MGKKTVSLGKNFMQQFKFLLKIVIPSVKTKEFGILLLHSGFLVSRTALSIFIAKLDGWIVKSLVDRDGKQFIRWLGLWLGIAVPATYINSMIKYLESKLSIAFRTRMVEYSYEQYMKNETYYRVGNLDSRIANADQCITEDVAKFCNFLSHLYSQLSKPILDVALIAQQFFWATRGDNSSTKGVLPLALCAVVIYATARILKMIQPPFGKLAAENQKLEGDLRFVHSRLITHAEEIAFYGGEHIELGMLQRSYVGLVKHMNVIFRTRIVYNMMEGFFMKYVWSILGLLMIAIPAFMFEDKTETAARAAGAVGDIISTRTSNYVTTRQLLVSAADAIERIMLAFKEVNELAGYTHNVYEMLSVFEDVRVGNYQKRSVAAAEGDINSKRADSGDIRKNRGVVIEGDVVKFDNVPIVSPNGDVLIPDMTFEIQPGMHLLITGPNGAGKSSLFRILGGLWPVYGGTVVKPALRDMFYIPQKPYLSLGNLRDQIIYPDTAAQMREKGRSDSDLMSILEWVNLTYIVSREGGWDASNDWQDVLSGGEKQRVGMARLFYHKPKFAILDECTSAVSIDVEGKIYQHAQDLGITLMTVTHRPSLWKFHNFLLQFDGQGGFSFKELNADVRVSFKEEKSKIESQLAGVDKMSERLAELCQLLGESSVVLDSFRKQEKGKKPADEPAVDGEAEKDAVLRKSVEQAMKTSPSAEDISDKEETKTHQQHEADLMP
jgi:ABC-type uncharacterized transport system fused permease/ATPase subunit